MLRCVTYITITQVPTLDFPDRKLVLFFDFVNEFTASDSWASLTNKGTIVLPKKIYYKDKYGRQQPLEGTNKNIGGFSNPVPFFLRGDTVKIEAGYRYFNQSGSEVTDTSVMFTGYISKVSSKKPINLELEDNMWKLKQVQAIGGNNQFFSKNKYTVESMVKEMMVNSGLTFSVNTTTSTSVGDFLVQNETIAEVLARMQKEYGFMAYFRGNELRVGSFVYIESDAITNTFVFQQNIISDELDYQRKDDIVLSAVATNTIDELTGKHTKDGQEKTKKKKLEVLVTFRNSNTKPEIYIASKGKPIPPNTGGERRTLKFFGAKTTDELATLAANELRKYYYTGYKGKFTTFGIPFVKQGDNVVIQDPLLPERDGKYKVKSVEYKGGVSGLRQVVTLDYKIGV